MLAAAVVLVSAGLSLSITVASSAQGSSTPASAVTALLGATQNDDLIGVLNSIAPGERAAIEPGVSNFVHQLERLDILSKSTNLNNVTGLSFRFSGIQTSTRFLSSSVAAVTITHGTITSGAVPSKLPVGSFVTSLVNGLSKTPSTSSTSTAKTGNSAIVTVNENGEWYISLGYTIAVNALSSKGVPATLPPASSAIAPIGANSPQGAVTAFLDAIAAFDLKGLIADLAPGEMGALQRFAPRFLPAAAGALLPVKQLVQVKFTTISTSTEHIGSLTLVRITKIGLRISARGTTITIDGHCETVTSQGHSKTTCSASNSSQAVLGALPPGVRALVSRLENTHPNSGVVTVKENGRWYISPVATIFQSVNSVASELQPQDLTMIATYAKDPIAAKKAFAAFEKALLGLVASGTSVV